MKVDRPAPSEDPSRFELAELLDEELGRLRASYRAPIVLCYLEGMSHEEAARRLGWPVGTVKGRLARARDLLRGRLTRRGVTLSAGALITALTQPARAGVPTVLIQITTRLAAGPLSVLVIPATVTLLAKGAVLAMIFSPWKMAGMALVVLGLGVGVGVGVGVGSGVLAVQQKTPEQLQEARTAAVPKAAPEEVRPELAKYEALQRKLDDTITMNFPNETPLVDVLKYIKAASEGPNDNGIPIYVDPEGLKDVGKSVTSPISLDIEGAVPLRDSLKQLLRPIGLDYRAGENGVLKISSRTAILEEENQALKRELGELKSRLKGQPTNPETPERSRNTDGPAQKDDPRTQSILKKLEEPISMSFAQETPLEDVIKYIKSATQGPDGRGIPIYIDPVGLNEAEKTTTSPVILDLEGVPLKTTLRLLLAQLGLCYKVEDGLMTITSESSESNGTVRSTQPDGVRSNLEESLQHGGFSGEEIRGLINMLSAYEQLQTARQSLDKIREKRRGKGGGFQ